MLARPETPLLRQPLIRMLAINLAIGVGIALLMLGGLLALNPHGLRNLIMADRFGGAVIGLLLFGLIVTFGSVAMGTAVMMLGKDKTNKRSGGKRQALSAQACPVRAAAR